jgi:hypothetical protein
MDPRPTDYSAIVERILTAYAAVPYAYGDLKRELVIDQTRTRFLLMRQGWYGQQRFHSCLIDVRIRGDKIWIEEDHTEDGIVDDLLAAGIPSKQLVLAWHLPAARKLTEFAES